MIGKDINLKVNTTTRKVNEKYKDALIPKSIIKKCNINKDFNNAIDAKKLWRSFFNINIKKGNHEENLKNFLKELERRGHIKGHETYNKNGAKVVIKNINRFEAKV